ncbi:MAG: hypothetical protein ACW972_03530 [Promethearchaeota archaeon]|jgi:hypothetical protein
MQLPKISKTRIGGKKSKRRNNSPSRQRYWAGRHLEKNKVKKIMKSHKLTRAEALKYWTNMRTNRVKDGFFRSIA